jgi:hypothetical protein
MIETDKANNILNKKIQRINLANKFAQCHFAFI